MPRALLRSNSCSSSLASNLSSVSPSSETSPLSHTKSAGEEQCHCFSQNSAGGKPLPVVDGEKHIKFLHLHLSQGKSSVCDLSDFSKLMNQGNESCIKASNILHGTKAALAMFCMLPEDKRDSVTTEATNFYKATVGMRNSYGKKLSVHTELEKFNKALLKASGLANKSADKQNNLDDFCTNYLNHFVYSDVIDKLSGVITPEQLEVIKGDPEKIIKTLYHDLNETNNLMNDTLKEGVSAHKEVLDKATQMHELITKLEHKTEIIAGIISKSLASDSPAASPDVNLPESPRTVPDYDMAQSATPANGTPVTPFVNNYNPVNNVNIDLRPLVDGLKGIQLLLTRLLPGNVNAEPTRHVESTEVGTQTPEAPRESEPTDETKSEKSVEQQELGNPQSKPKVPLMATLSTQTASNDDDEIDGVSRSAVAPQPETPPNVGPKKTTYLFKVKRNVFDSQRSTPRYVDVPRVALTGGATIGTSESRSYRESDTHKLAQKNSSPTASQLADALKLSEEQGAKATKSVNSAGSEFQGLYNTLNSTPIKFTPKKETVEYRLNESLNGKAN